MLKEINYVTTYKHQTGFVSLRDTKLVKIYANLCELCKAKRLMRPKIYVPIVTMWLKKTQSHTKRLKPRIGVNSQCRRHN